MRMLRNACENGSIASVLVLGLLLLLVLATPTRAQTTTATISGEVTDPNGAKVPGAKVTATNVQTNNSRSVTADEDGRFVISELAPGPYEVIIERQGFNKELRRGLVLTVGRDAVLIVALKVGDIAQQVEITGDASLVNTTTSEVSALVNERTIKELPLNGRDLLQLATLQIGVVNIGSISETQINSGTGSVKMSINGGRMSFNNFLLDGTSVNEVQNTTPGSVAGGFTGVDSVQEFQLLTNNYSAEFGGAGGGIINMVTKAGGNEVHGTAFEFLRNSALDARNPFDTVDLDGDGKADLPPFKRNQFGGSIGAPIRKNKTFIFGAYEGFRQRLANTNTFFVPTVAARNGTDPELPPPAPAMIPYINFYPLPNGGDVGGGLGVFTRSETGRIDENYFLIRGDHNISTKDTFFARYLFDDSDRDDPGAGNPRTVNTDSLLKARNQYVGLGETHIFNPHLLNTVRFAFNRSRVEGDEVDVVKIPESLFWVPGATAIGLFRDLGGLSPLSDRTLVPRFLVGNNIEVSDQLGYVRGAHNMKFGFTFRRIQLNAVSANIPFGAYIFGSYENFLTANYFIFAVSLPTANDVYRGIRTSLFAGYFQDDWRVRNNLTLNLGLRYEPMTSPTEANNKVSNLRDYINDSAATVGLPFFKNNTKKNFAPRVGFAWDVFGDGKTSLRGGYGIFFAQAYPAGYRFEMSNQAPFDIIGFTFGPALGALFGLPPEFFPPFPNAFSSLSPASGLATETYEFDPQPSYVQQWNLTGQRQLFGGLTATISYVGSRGIHLPTNGNRNTSANFTLLPNGEKQFPPGENDLRNPAFGPIRVTTHSGDSYYHALQVNLERRFAQGLQMQMAYTFSKSIDTSSDSVGAYLLESTQFAQDPYNLRGDRGLSVFDVRHNFSLNTVWQLPYKTDSSAHGSRRVQDFFLGGWEVNSIITARSGTPFNPIITFNNANDGNTDNVQRPAWAPGATPESAITGGTLQYFNPSAFVVPPSGQYGNVGRNVLTGPGLFTVDLSFLKTNNIGERLKVQFRAEAFNLFNRANFALPDVVTVFTDADGTVPPNVGRITRTSTTSRQLQFGVKLIF